jgi:hypothetical protein
MVPILAAPGRPFCARAYGTGKKIAVFMAPDPKEASMNIHLALAPLVSLLAGILILIIPRLLNYIVAVYLIVIGLIGLFGAGNMRL